jgi:hypothetical protein
MPVWLTEKSGFFRRVAQKNIEGAEPILKHKKQWMKLRGHSKLSPPPPCQQFFNEGFEGLLREPNHDSKET